MSNRRRFLALAISLSFSATANAADPPRVAGVVTIYRTNSHAEMILNRLLDTETLDGKGRRPNLKLASVYVDQVGPNDLSVGLARKHGFRRSPTVADALTLGTGKLAVDGVLLIAEHGDYPTTADGQTAWPKRRLFSEVAAVFEQNGRSVPVFHDKHLADDPADALWYYETALRLKAPLMAGSSIPWTWRDPAIDVPAGTDLR
ncbi:MAG: hypothetical protein ACRDD1_10195, partial [Planctomycetia bacterium]